MVTNAFPTPQEYRSMYDTLVFKLRIARQRDPGCLDGRLEEIQKKFRNKRTGTGAWGITRAIWRAAIRRAGGKAT